MAESLLPWAAAGTQLLHVHLRVAQASELGVTLIDTADIYGQGKNEELVGKTNGLCSGCAWGRCSLLLRQLLNEQSDVLTV